MEKSADSTPLRSSPAIPHGPDFSAELSARIQEVVDAQAKDRRERLAGQSKLKQEFSEAQKAREDAFKKDLSEICGELSEARRKQEASDAALLASQAEHQRKEAKFRKELLEGQKTQEALSKELLEGQKKQEAREKEFSRKQDAREKEFAKERSESKELFRKHDVSSRDAH